MRTFPSDNWGRVPAFMPCLQWHSVGCQHLPGAKPKYSAPRFFHGWGRHSLLACAVCSVCSSSLQPSHHSPQCSPHGSSHWHQLAHLLLHSGACPLLPQPQGRVCAHLALSMATPPPGSWGGRRRGGGKDCLVLSTGPAGSLSDCSGPRP